jgi:hypothetical protein
MSFRPKISPSPPFDYAQDMLFKEGLEIPQRKIPPFSKGDEGGFDFDLSGCHGLEFFNEF